MRLERVMKKMNRILAIVAAAAVLTLAACEHKGPAEKVGEKVDNAAEQAGDTLDKATDKMKGVMGDIKDKAGDAVDKMKDRD
jgi:predicted small lipoprotein YifL